MRRVAALSSARARCPIGELRERGIEALAIDALLARIGTADPVEPVASLGALVATVDFARVGRAAARFSEDELAQLSARTLHILPFGSVKDRMGEGIDEALWLAVRGNLTTLADAKSWAEIVRGPLAPTIEDAPFLVEAAAKLPPEPWDETTWKAWTSTLATALGRKGKALFHPLRPRPHRARDGPEMAKLLPLIGRAGPKRGSRGGRPDGTRFPAAPFAQQERLV